MKKGGKPYLVQVTRVPKGGTKPTFRDKELEKEIQMGNKQNSMSGGMNETSQQQ